MAPRAPEIRGGEDGMADRIFLTGLAFFGRHGALPAERELGGRFVVDVEALLDLCPAGTRDDLAATVDYAAMYERIRRQVEDTRYDLLEALAEHLAADLLAAFPLLDALTVRVHKPGAPI